MSYILLEWTEFLVRWLHVIAGIAWIGSSFYFIALDLSLLKKKDIPKEAHGEAWQVHGGGFYQIVKYLVAPDKLPSQLTWFKWEAYATWISGFLDTPAPSGWRGVDGWQSACEHAHLPPRQVVARPPSSHPGRWGQSKSCFNRPTSAWR